MGDIALYEELIELEQYKKKYCSEFINNTEYVPTQEPYISSDGLTYEVNALRVPEFNEDYPIEVKLYWQIICVDCTDESEACDWTKPFVKE